MAQIASGQAAKAEEQKKQLEHDLQHKILYKQMDCINRKLTKIDRYNELRLEQGYTDDYAKAYLGFL